MKTQKTFFLLILSALFLTNVVSAQYPQYYYPQTSGCSSSYGNCYKKYHRNNYNYNNNYVSLTPTTYSASNIYQSTAKINGYINYSGTGYNQNVGYTWFEYGASPYNLNLSTNKSAIYSNTSTDANLSNLTCGQTYYYRAVSSGTNGTQYGSTLSFTTSACYNYYQNYIPYNYYNHNNNYDYNNYNCPNNWYGY